MSRAAIETLFRRRRGRRSFEPSDRLNGALQALRDDPAHKVLAKMGVDTLLQHLDEVPEAMPEAADVDGAAAGSGGIEGGSGIPLRGF